MAFNALDHMIDCPKRDDLLEKAHQHIVFDCALFRDPDDAVRCNDGHLEFAVETIVNRHNCQRLARKQARYRDPALNWLKKRHNVELKPTKVVVETPKHDPAMVKRFVNDVLQPMDPWELAAVASLSHLLRSYVLALATLQGEISPQHAVSAFRVDEDHQTDEWGRVEGGHDLDDAYLNLGARAAFTFHQLSGR